MYPAPIIYNISGDGQLKNACTNADIVGDITGYIVREPRVGVAGIDSRSIRSLSGVFVVLPVPAELRINFRFFSRLVQPL